MQFTRAMLPEDLDEALLVGRLLLDDGPTPVAIRDGVVEDVSRAAPTIADLMDLEHPAEVAGERLFDVDDLQELPLSRFLAPVDLQAIKRLASPSPFPPSSG